MFVFLAIVCKTVRPILSDRCLSVSLSCPVLSATLVHCAQTVRWIKTKIGTEVGLGPGHIVFDGEPLPPPQTGHSSPPHLLLLLFLRAGVQPTLDPYAEAFL